MKKILKECYGKLSLAKKITFLNIGMIAFVLVSFTLILQVFFEKAVLDIVTESYVQRFETVSDNCADILLDAERITKVLFTDEDVENWFQSDEETGLARRLQQRMKVESRLDYLEALYPENQFSSISVYTTGGEMVNTNSIRSRAAAYLNLLEEIQKMPEKPAWLDLYEYEDEEGPGDGIAYMRPYREYSSGQVKGYIVVEYNSELLQKIFTPLKYQAEGQYLITDTSGNVKLASENTEQTAQNIADRDFFQWVLQKNNDEGKSFQIGGERCLVTAAEIGTLDWMMIGVTPVSMLLEPGKIMTVVLYVVGVFAVAAAALLSFFVAHTVARPLSELADTMKRFGKGDLHVSVPVRSGDETGVLADAFNKMTVQIETLVQQVYREQRDKRKYEFAVLQAQINPHFLYNTLSSVSALIKMNRPDDAFQMIHAIGQFYRTALSSGKNLISLRTEVENIESYIQIQKMRYRDKIIFQIEFDEAIMDVPIVKLTLQPIVENAIYHGVKNVPHQGKISVCGAGNGADVVIRISDNGAGMSAERAEEILSEEEKSREKSFGLYSIRQRLRLYFGEEAGISIQSKPGEGTEVIVKIPGQGKAGHDEISTDR